MKITIINGPNLNLLGKREPEIYGSLSFEKYLQQLRERFPHIDLQYVQSNEEGKLIDALHEAGFTRDGILLNAGGYSHTSVALRDAIASISAPVVEVHISNIFAREPFRHHSLISAVCKGSIVGLGLEGYALGIMYFIGQVSA
ncbi:MAG: type II 3-dehydroquinate dehydratase [Thermoflavifilum sp.]|nr:type II 3-dehydroquinate dehydratase [Thermoflavifilum sp.]